MTDEPYAPYQKVDLPDGRVGVRQGTPTHWLNLLRTAKLVVERTPPTTPEIQALGIMVWEAEQAEAAEKTEAGV